MNLLVNIGLLLIFIGFVALFTGLAASSLKGEANVKGGGVVFLGPVPIVFGTDSGSAVAAGIVGLLLMVAYYYIRR